MSAGLWDDYVAAVQRMVLAEAQVERLQAENERLVARAEASEADYRGARRHVARLREEIKQLKMERDARPWLA